jgi:toxin YoeB
VKLSIASGAIEDLEPWSTIKPKVLSRIIRLIAETTRTPLTGTGKPERLKQLGGEVCSRRITEKDRLVYDIQSDVITITACRFHYDDHRSVREVHQAVGLEAIIQPVQLPAAPATRQALASRKLALMCAVFTGFWALSGAACCPIFLDPQPALGRLGLSRLPAPLVTAIVIAAIMYAVFWASLPVTLLIVGIGHLRVAAPGWRWPATWAGIVAAGIALDPLSLAASSPFDTSAWHWLALSVALLVIGAAMIAILTGPTRSRARGEHRQLASQA